jgi:hypothetical protein
MIVLVQGQFPFVIFVDHGSNMEIKLVILLTHLCRNSLTNLCGNIKGTKHKGKKGDNITTFMLV